MAPCGAALHRRRRRGELGRLPLPHRRRRAVRGVGGRGLRPRQRNQLARCRVTVGGGGRCARTPAKPCATSPLSAAPSPPQRDLSGVTAAAPDLPPRHLPCPPEPTNASRSQRQRSSSMPTSGTPAHTSLGGTSNTLLAALAARLAQASGTSRSRRLGHLDDAHQRAHRRRYPRQRHHERRHHGRPGTRDDGPARDPGRNKASADPLTRRSPTNGGHCCPSFPWCLSGSASDGSARPPTVRPAWAHPTSVRSTRPSTGQTAQTPTTSP